jgi:RHS repeat-associated protein
MDRESAIRPAPPGPGSRTEASGRSPAAPGAPAPPAITLPKGGGALRGIGEKFSANPVTGTGTLTVPIAASPGRAGFGPDLSLVYDSGAGNGPFGLGWSLSLPAITRKTDRGIPQYRDDEESDVFLLSGAEDLVPVPGEGPDPRAGTPRTVDGVLYHVHRYRPRVEGLFARIERWTDTRTGQAHWRSISRDDVTTVFGRTAASRIEDPAGGEPRTFSWLICERWDDRGNAAVYEYRAEDSAGVDLAAVHEANRTPTGRGTNRYLKRVRYGNRVSRLRQPDLARTEWMFEVVLDYGEHDPAAPRPDDCGAWRCRRDPFSSYRAGFEVRTYRRCERVLAFHHFPGEETGTNCLVRSTDFTYRDEPTVSLLASVTQRGYVRREGGYRVRALPPLELAYSRAEISGTVRELDAESLENLPAGVDGARWQWVDLDGEGASGILTEQAGGWYYKRNLGEGRFGALAPLPTQPSLAALGGGRQQLLDLAGDGQIELVQLDLPTPGFFERTADGGWESFRTFRVQPRIAWDDPNLRFVDLNGDGHADVLITGEEVFTWHPSRAEEGFGPASHVSTPHDEERGPRLVFADGTQSIYLADMSGDGLTDLVRIRNGEVCYWPNLGYGRFGARVAMDGAPWFDAPDLFDQRRVRVADVDGSGASDIVYLAPGGACLYFNQAGNGWSAPRTLRHLPPLDDTSAASVVDLLGNGTACLVWSSPLPGNARRPLRYVDLMGGQKPHLLVRTRNNLGAETRIEYAPSTRFYFADRRAGRPWITRLPFPVHCVHRVTVTDHWRQTSFASTYSYHHGCFDGVEREFRGFGRVEQVDVESYGAFARGNAASPYVTGDGTLYQPPVKTVTWYHTGAAGDRRRILSLFADEYFPGWWEEARPELAGGFRERAIPEPELAALGLTAKEWREALRACKGVPLRQETYELDVDALERGEHLPVKLLSAAAHGYRIRRVQPMGTGRHAVFLVTESESLTYHYELDLRGDVPPDPRIAHSLTLSADEYGNPRQAVAVVYPRAGRYEDAGLAAEALARIHAVQRELHATYTEHRYTDDVSGPDVHRLRVPCEVLTYALTGLPAPADGRWYGMGELRRLRLSDAYPVPPAYADAAVPVGEVAYHEIPGDDAPRKRCVERVRTLFFTDGLDGPLPFGQQGRLGLPYESYTLALTEGLLSAVFADKLTPEVRAVLDDPAASGYLGGAALAARLAPLETAGQHWRRSGTAGFAPDAAEHFYLPERFTDPFGNVTRVEYDPLDLFAASSTDALGNTTRVVRFDYRVLAPREIADPNDNLSETWYDALGLPVAAAVKGKGAEGDTLSGMDDALANPDPAALAAFFTAPAYDEAQARRWLAGATARHVYHFGETVRADGTVAWGTHPACACGIAREKHVAALAPGEASPLQAAFEYSDGLGAVLVKKAQAEPEVEGGPLRWIASGKTVLNNKGKPVKQYEPYFSESGHRFEEPREVGVTPILYYDAAGRLIRTEAPDGSYSRVEFSPWHVASFDANDTVREPGNAWYARRTTPAASAEERRAARLAALHAATPAVTVLDSLGREVIAIAHNRVPDDAPAWAGTPLIDRPWLDERHLTVTRLDAEGKPLWVRDARGNLVMQYVSPPVPSDQPADPVSGFVPCYDIAGNLLFQHSMDGGGRWSLMDAAGKPMLAWDFNERIDASGAAIPEHRRYHTRYDALHRPLETWLTVNDEPAALLVERFVYGEALPDAAARNLRGQLHRHYDPSGRATQRRFDFSGKLLDVERVLAGAWRAPVIDWSPGSPTAVLEDEPWERQTEYDALGRMTRQYDWHRGAGTRVAVYEPRYNARGLLASEDLVLRATRTASGYTEGPGASRTPAVRAVRYDAKGQTERIEYGNRTVTRYRYDPETFRLLQLRTTRPGSDPDFPAYHAALRDDAVLQQLHYTYDPAGNVTEIHDEAYEPVFFRNQIVLPRSLYVYDALYRLIEASGRERATATGAPMPIEHGTWGPFPVTDPAALRNYTQRYRYDAVGNITEMRHVAGSTGSWTRHNAYAADSNRLRRTWTGSSDADAVVYRYDTHGSMLNLANAPEELSLRWDHRDMIHSVDLGGGGVAWYAYDAGKERSRKLVASHLGVLQWERLYLGGAEVYRRYDGMDTPTEEIETHPLFVGEQRVLLVEDVLTTTDAALGTGPRFRYQYTNHLGSACVELDEEARVISYEEYHPYGTSAWQMGRSEAEVRLKRYRYTGKERDAETGLSYHSARYYAPWLGRWVSADPAGLVDGANLYAFAASSPISRIDSDGRQSFDAGVRQMDASVPAASVPVYVTPPASSREEAEGASLPEEHLMSNETAGPPPTGAVGTDSREPHAGGPLGSGARGMYNFARRAPYERQAITAWSEASTEIRRLESARGSVGDAYTDAQVQRTVAQAQRTSAAAYTEAARSGVTQAFQTEYTWEAHHLQADANRSTMMTPRRANLNANITRVTTYGAGALATYSLVTGAYDAYREISRAPEGERMTAAGRVTARTAGSALGAEVGASFGVGLGIAIVSEYATGGLATPIVMVCMVGGGMGGSVLGAEAGEGLFNIELLPPPPIPPSLPRDPNPGPHCR